MTPTCPKCDSTTGFDSAPLGEGYFVLVCCTRCGVVVGVAEYNAVWPAVEEVKGQVQGLDARIRNVEALLLAK